MKKNYSRAEIDSIIGNIISLMKELNLPPELPADIRLGEYYHDDGRISVWYNRERGEVWLGLLGHRGPFPITPANLKFFTWMSETLVAWQKGLRKHLPREKDVERQEESFVPGWESPDV